MQLPPILAESLDAARGNLSVANKRAGAEIDGANKRYDETVRVLNRIATEFLTTGVAVFQDYHWCLRDLRSRYVRGLSRYNFIRDLAREARRPNVCAFINHGNVYLNIQKRVYTQPLVSGVLLMATIADNAFVQHEKRWCRDVYSDRWSFQFNGDEGRKIFDIWRGLCVTDPAMRKALRLDRPPAYLIK